MLRESLFARGHRLLTKVGLLMNPRGQTLSNNMLIPRLLFSGETTNEVTLCHTGKHHAKGDIAGSRQSSMPRGINIAEQRWRFEGSLLPYKVDQRVKRTLNCSYDAQGFLRVDTAIAAPLPLRN